MSKLNHSIDRRSFLAGTFGLAATATLAACNSESTSSSDAGSSAGSSASSSAAASETQTLTVAASPTPHAEILNNFAAPLLADQGITLEVTEFTDYIQPNEVVSSGEIDANYFQHINYLDNYNAENGTDIVAVARIHYEPFGIYAGKSDDLSNIPDGAEFAVPNDPTNEARALLLLQQEGIITLEDPDDIEATTNDIVDNPHNITFREVEAAATPRTLEDVDFAAINLNYALEADLHVADALAVEEASGAAVQQYANVIATEPDLEDDERIQALVAVLTSDDFKTYLSDTYDQDVLPAF